MHSDDNTAAVLAGRREWTGLAVLGLPALLLAVDASVVFLALPRISLALAASSTQQLWIIDIYGFMIAGFLVTMGSLGDRIGRRRLLLAGAACFALTSVLAACSTSAGMLIGARALMGVAGATIMPSALALIGDMFPNPRQQGMAIAVFISCFMAGAAIGPVVGGLLLTSFWWGSVFLAGVPAMAVLMVAGPLLLPERRKPAAARLDLVSVVLYLAAILPLIYSLNELARAGWKPGPVISLAAGLAFGAVFLRRQQALSTPLLDLSLFRHRSFSAALTIMLLGGAMMSGLSLFFTLFVQVVRGWSALTTGLWMVVSAVSMVLGSMLAPAAARKIPPGRVLAAGLGLAAAGFLLISLVRQDAPMTWPIVGVAVLSLGAGAFASLGTGLVVGSVPADQAGSAASVAETSGEFGGAFGIAMLGSIGTAIYRGMLHLPAKVPPWAASAARESITRAAMAAKSLPAAARTTALGAANAAFTTALQAVTIIAAIVAVGLALLALIALRPVPPQSTTPAPGGGEDPTLVPASQRHEVS